MYFIADDGVHGFEPWVTDGTAAGTRMIVDVVPGPTWGYFDWPVAYGGKLYADSSAGFMEFDADGSNVRVVSASGRLAVAGLDDALLVLTYAQDGTKPVVRFGRPGRIREGSGFVGRPIAVAARPADRVARWTIAWGDGTKSVGVRSGASIPHVYEASGIYAVTLSGRQADSAAVQRTFTVRVENVAPTATAAVAAPVGEVVPGEPVTFAGVVGDPGPHDFLAVRWDFGDGDTTWFGPALAPDALRPTHIYSKPGTYTARLRVVDSAGARAQATVTVRVRPVVVRTIGGEETLIVGGTDGADSIAFVSRLSRFELLVNGESFGRFGVERIVAYGLGGDDSIVADTMVSADMTLFGGAGLDLLIGGTGTNRIFAD